MLCLCQRDRLWENTSFTSRSKRRFQDEERAFSLGMECMLGRCTALPQFTVPSRVHSGLAPHITPSRACSVVSLHSIPVRVCTTVPLHTAVLPEPGDCCPFTQHSCQGLESLLLHRHGVPAQIHVGSHLSTEF